MSYDDQEIRFCTSADGVRIAYATVGAGPPLVKAANWLSHLEFDWNSPVWRHWLRELSRTHTLIRYDERACGLSDWDVEDYSLDAWVRDLEAVVAAQNLERFPLLGISQGGPIAIAYAVRNPGKVSHLILYGSYARGRLFRNPTPEMLEEREVMLRMAQVGWGKEHPAFRQVFTSLFIPGGSPEHVNWFNDLQRISTSPENAVRIMEAFDTLDTQEMAKRIDIPTLVLHSKDDLRIPFSEGRLLASLIPGARFVPLEGKNHVLLENEPSWPRFLSEVRNFLGTHPQEQPTLKVRAGTDPAKPILSTHTRWHEISALFERAVALPTAERAVLLNKVEASDPELRREVEGLLNSDAKTDLLQKLDGVLGASALSLGGSGDWAGKTISHYEVLEKLDEGGMGTIFKARDQSLDRMVALKLLPRYLSQDLETKHRFIREARAVAALDHPNICTIYEVAEHDGQLFIAMPCYDGETLKEKIKRGQLPLAETLDYSIQIAEGLEHAHQSGIVHRDIKPANVIVTSGGLVKILDFGIARTANTNLTRTGVVMGTLAYMSPQQSRGEVVDQRSDLWSLGVVIYEMLSGKQAFAGTNDVGMIHSIQRSKPRSLMRLRPKSPKEFVVVVTKLLEKNADKRPASAAEVALALRGIDLAEDPRKQTKLRR